MGYSTWCKGKDMRTWADSLEARQKLPALVRRLIHATVENPKLVQFPADEGTQRRGCNQCLQKEAVLETRRRCRGFSVIISEQLC